MERWILPALVFSTTTALLLRHRRGRFAMGGLEMGALLVAVLVALIQGILDHQVHVDDALFGGLYFALPVILGAISGLASGALGAAFATLGLVIVVLIHPLDGTSISLAGSPLPSEIAAFWLIALLLAVGAALAARVSRIAVPFVASGWLLFPLMHQPDTLRSLTPWAVTAAAIGWSALALAFIPFAVARFAAPPSTDGPDVSHGVAT